MNQLDKYKIDLTKDEYAIVISRNFYNYLCRTLPYQDLQLLDQSLTITIQELPARLTSKEEDGNL